MSQDTPEDIRAKCSRYHTVLQKIVELGETPLQPELYRTDTERARAFKVALEMQTLLARHALLS